MYYSKPSWEYLPGNVEVQISPESEKSQLGLTVQTVHAFLLPISWNSVRAATREKKHGRHFSPVSFPTEPVRPSLSVLVAKPFEYIQSFLHGRKYFRNRN